MRSDVHLVKIVHKKNRLKTFKGLHENAQFVKILRPIYIVHLHVFLFKANTSDRARENLFYNAI